MAYSVLTAKADLSAMLHGTTTNQITNLNGLFNRAARQVLMDCDPQETKRTVPITNQVFNQVYDYAVPSDLKGNRVIDIKPQVNRFPTEVFAQQYNQAFDLSKANSTRGGFTINFNQSIKTIRIDAPFLTTPVQLNTCDTLTGNGTWVAGGGAASLSVDNVNFVNSAGALQFNLTAGPTTGYLENSTMTAQDISAWLNQGTQFLYTYLPTASAITNVNLRWGSSSSNYYSVNATVDHQGNAFQNGWNLLSFAWLGASVTGSPDPTAINYLRVTWTYDGTLQTAVHLDQVTASLGTILEMEYYSKFMFRDASTNVFQETVTADSNLINLDLEAYNLILYKIMEYAVQQQQGLDATFYDGPYFANLYDECLARYTALYKSEVQKPQQTYYGMPRANQNTVNRIRRGF